MPWNKDDYPDSMKNLETDVREKAIEIANALLEDNYEEGRAISIATSQARIAIHGDEEEYVNDQNGILTIYEEDGSIEDTLYE